MIVRHEKVQMHFDEFFLSCRIGVLRLMIFVPVYRPRLDPMMLVLSEGRRYRIPAVKTAQRALPRRYVPCSAK